jgi:tetratricopeptide (TPR) repeat protein
VKRAIMPLLVFCLAGAAFGFDYHSYKPITYDDFVKVLVETSTEHGHPLLTIFRQAMRIRLTLKDYPQLMKKEDEHRFAGIDALMGRKVGKFYHHYSVQEFKAKMFKQSPETCRIYFLWQDVLVPYLKKEVKPGQTIDIYAIPLTFNGFDCQGLVLVNEFKTDLAPMDVADYTKALEANPRDAKAYYLRGLANSEKGQYDQAIADFTKVLEINPKDAQAYLNRGRAYSDKKQYGRAVSDYSKVIEISPRNEEAYNSRGVAYGKQGQYDQAIADFTKVLEINPRNASAYTNRGFSYESKRQYDQAIGEYTKALEINPKDLDAYFNRGNAYRMKGQNDQAILDYTKALEISPSSAKAYYQRAQAYFSKKEYEKAWEDVKKVQNLGYKIKPEFLQALKKATGTQD